MDEIVRTANHLTKQVIVAEEGVDRCGKEKLFMFDLDSRQEQNNKVLNYVIIEEAIEKPIV